MTKTNFFTQLSELGLKELALDIRIADNGSMTIFVTPKCEALSKSNTMSEAFKNITPFSLTAMPAQLDEEFFTTVGEPMAETGKVISNMQVYKAQLEEANKLAAEKKDKAAASKTEAKEPAAPKISKEEQAKLDKIAKAESNVREHIALCTTYTTFGKNKAKLKKLIDALKAVMETTKLPSTLHEPAQAFFEANNAIMDGSFVGFVDPNVTEKAQDNAANVLKEPVLPEGKAIESVDVTGEIPDVTSETPLESEENAVLQTDEDKEIFADAIANPPQANEKLKNAIEGYNEKVSTGELSVEDGEDPGQSLADMNAERTEERKSQLRSLGLTEDNTGFIGHGFNVRESIIQGHNKEYWDELIKGIQEVVNKDEQAYEAAATLANVQETPAAPQVVEETSQLTETEQRFETRKARLLELGFEIVGMEFKQNHFVVSAELVKTNGDDWFDKVIEHFTKEVTVWKQRTKDRIIQLINFGIKETGDGQYTHPIKPDIVVSINEIQTEPNDRWDSAMKQISGMLSLPPAMPPAPDAKADLVLVMNPSAPHSYEAYKQAGWKDEQLVQQGLASYVEQQTAQAPKAPEAPAAPASLLGGEDESLIS